jgi:probable F420-dependent oxidoreductase
MVSRTLSILPNNCCLASMSVNRGKLCTLAFFEHRPHRATNHHAGDRQQREKGKQAAKYWFDAARRAGQIGCIVTRRRELTMLIGLDMPIRGPLATPEIMTRIAVEAEAMGYGYVVLGDHIVMPNTIRAPYPYTESGELPLPGRAGRHEQLTTIAYLAAKTTRLRFVTGIMVVPHRPPVLAAKVLATIDILSAGRLTVACGAGWLKEEFEALNLPPFAERGTVTDEYLAVFRELWAKESSRFEGKYVRFSDVEFTPKPVQKPHPPLWIGGEGGPAMRRAARTGDGWYPIGTNPSHPLDTLERYRSAVEHLRGLAREAGRDPARIALGYYCAQHGAIEQPAGSGGRKLFVGSPAEIAGDLGAFAKLGVTCVDFRLGAPTADEAIANMRRFREDVLARI